MCKVPVQALAVIDHDPRYADRNLRRWIAGRIDRHESTVSRILADETTMDYNQAARLSRALCDELDETRFAECFIGAKYVLLKRAPGSANGVFHDEVVGNAEAIGDWIDAMKDGDSTAARKACDKLQIVLDNMRAETDRI